MQKRQLKGIQIRNKAIKIIIALNNKSRVAGTIKIKNKTKHLVY